MSPRVYDGLSKAELEKALRETTNRDEQHVIRDLLSRIALGVLHDTGRPAALDDEQDTLPFT